MKVIKVMFGDWSENFVCNVDWGYWNEWYGYKDKVDERIDILESNNSIDGYESEVVDVKKIMDDCSCEKWGEFIMDISGGEYDEFSFSVFNVERFKKLNGRVVKCGKNGEFSILEDNGSIEWSGMWCNGEVSDECEYVMLSNDDMDMFKMVEWNGDYDIG